MDYQDGRHSLSYRVNDISIESGLNKGEKMVCTESDEKKKIKKKNGLE